MVIGLCQLAWMRRGAPRPAEDSAREQQEQGIRAFDVIQQVTQISQVVRVEEDFFVFRAQCANQLHLQDACFSRCLVLVVRQEHRKLSQHQPAFDVPLQPATIGENKKM
eukprot:SAG22_NODE_4157_length_1365_cov_1.327014_2_plen_109_part_00